MTERGLKLHQRIVKSQAHSNSVCSPGFTNLKFKGEERSPPYAGAGNPLFWQDILRRSHSSLTSLSVGTPSEENVETAALTPQDTFLETGHISEDKGRATLDNIYVTWMTIFTSLSNKRPSTLIVQEKKCPIPEGKDVSWRIPEQ